MGHTTECLGNMTGEREKLNTTCCVGNCTEDGLVVRTVGMCMKNTSYGTRIQEDHSCKGSVSY